MQYPAAGVRLLYPVVDVQDSAAMYGCCILLYYRCVHSILLLV
jgi:hypothetical protein